jgi:hypothetical protein
MSEQRDLVHKIIEALDKEGILQNLIVVGSWCIHFYRHHYKEAELLPPLRTRDIEFDVGPLKNSHRKVDVLQLIEKLGFIADFKGSGFTSLANPELIVEFLVPEKGKGCADPVTLSGFGINAQPIRYLSLLEEKLITVDYEGHMIKLPHPVWFAIHKLIISQRRPAKQLGKTENDIKQALAIWDMIVSMGKESMIKDLLNDIPKGWLKLVKKALVSTDEVDRLEKMMTQ